MNARGGARPAPFAKSERVADRAAKLHELEIEAEDRPQAHTGRRGPVHALFHPFAGHKDLNHAACQKRGCARSRAPFLLADN